MRAMDNSSGSSNFQHIGRWTALPHRTQLPQMPPSLNHYNLNHEVGSIGNPKPTGGQPTQSISSESVLIEEPPSWFEELLNEPDTPMQRGHRRSASDSLAYLGAVAKVSNTNEDHKFINSFAWPSFGSLCNASTYTRPSSFDENQNRAWESSLNCLNYTSDLPLTRDQPNIINVQVSGSCAPPDQPDGVPPIATKKQDCAESISHNQEDSSERSDSSSAQPSLSKNDAKRAKQYAFYPFISSINVFVSFVIFLVLISLTLFQISLNTFHLIDLKFYQIPFLPFSFVIFTYLSSH